MILLFRPPSRHGFEEKSGRSIRESGRLDLHEVLSPQDSCCSGEVPSVDRDESSNSTSDNPWLLHALSSKRGIIMQIDEGVVSQIRSKISYP